MSLRPVLEHVLGRPATDGNDVTVLRNGREIFPAMLTSINAARHTVDLLTFVYWSGDLAWSFAETLAAAARRGVRARVLLDSFGAHELADEVVETMVEAGVEVRWFRPLGRGNLGEVNERTHRKVLVCDGRVGFTGGVGIADEWDGDARVSGEWRDTHVRVEGPAVAGLAGAFLANWHEAGGALLDDRDVFPSHPGPGDPDAHAAIQVIVSPTTKGPSEIDRLLEALLLRAMRRVRLAGAYFNPTPELVELMGATAERGVQVQILLPGPHADKRVAQLASEDVYGPLVERGVEIWCFQPSMMHAKVGTVDGELALVGSANLNRRSLGRDEEVELVVHDARVTAILDEHFDDDLTRSEPIDPGRWQERGLVQRATEAVTRPFKDSI